MITCESVYGHTVTVDREKFTFRPSVYAVVFSEDRVLLVTSRTARKYCFPGGGIALGESIEEALRREMREETGIEVEIVRFLHFKEHFFYYDPEDVAFHSFMAFYLCRPKTTELVRDARVVDFDVERPRWIRVGDVRQEEFMPVQWELFERLLEGDVVGSEA